VTKRRTNGRAGKGFPRGRSKPGPAPAAGQNRPVASSKHGRAATARQAAADRKLRVAVIGVAVLILVAAGVLAFRGGSQTAGAVTNPAAFSLPALNGNGWVRLAHYRGKPVVVNFFASWCTECQAELPGFRQEAIALRGKVIFIGVDSLETGDKNFLPHLFTWPARSRRWPATSAPTGTACMPRSAAATRCR
jgi:thiol-disulfide isomerase/thioredoxin